MMWMRALLKRFSWAVKFWFLPMMFLMSAAYARFQTQPARSLISCSLFSHVHNNSLQAQRP